MRRFENVVKADEGTVLDLLGPTMEFLTSEEDSFCVMKGTIPPGLSVPLHSHTDAESFYILSGEAQAFVEIEKRLVCQTLRRGDFVQIPSGAKHAWRNASHDPIEALITVSAKLGRALREMGRPVKDGSRRVPTQEDIRRFVEISARYGYWLGSPEENAQLSIALSS
jgi:quercetin dioxygenase-like cupin family protein